MSQSANCWLRIPTVGHRSTPGDVHRRRRREVTAKSRDADPGWSARSTAASGRGSARPCLTPRGKAVLVRRAYPTTDGSATLCASISGVASVCAGGRELFRPWRAVPFPGLSMPTSVPLDVAHDLQIDLPCRRVLAVLRRHVQAPKTSRARAGGTSEDGDVSARVVGMLGLVGGAVTDVGDDRHAGRAQRASLWIDGLEVDGGE
jgi:hypothetical protein